jgi:hypothetical protein
VQSDPGHAAGKRVAPCSSLLIAKLNHRALTRYTAGVVAIHKQIVVTGTVLFLSLLTRIIFASFFAVGLQNQDGRNVSCGDCGDCQSIEFVMSRVILASYAPLLLLLLTASPYLTSSAGTT